MDVGPSGFASASVPAPAVPGLTDLSVLARGGYATIYQAVQESVGRDVAVKIENRSLESEHDRRRFLREARAAGRMSSHPHVVDLFDAGVTADGHPYLIMELCRGSFADLIKSSTLTPAQVRDVGMKIADALSDAHELGVLHRDVKPANILISEFGEPSLADFGLAVLAEMRDVSMTLDVLTPAYAPRETFRPTTRPSPAADVYSLCATLYALLHGQPPRWPTDRTPSLLTLLELFDRPIPDVPGMPAELMRLLRQGMDNDPSRRPSARQVGEALAGMAFPGDPSAVPAVPSQRPPVSWLITQAVPTEDWTLPTQPRPVAEPPLPARAAGMPAAEVPAAELLAAELLAAEVPAGASLSGAPSDALPRGAAPQSAGPEGAAPQSAGPEGAGLLGAVPQGVGPLGVMSRAAVSLGGSAAVLGRLQGRARRWPVLTASALVIVLSLTTAGWYSIRHGATSARAGTLATPPSGQASNPVAPGGCMLGVLGAECPRPSQCFDRLSMSNGVATARSLPCREPHTWEVFALGTLPPEVTGVAYQSVRGSQSVEALCSPAALALVNLHAVGWHIDVLPPTPSAFAKGDRTFRCLAGTGPNQQSTSLFDH